MFGKTISRFRISLRFGRNHFPCILCTFYRGIEFFNETNEEINKHGTTTSSEDESKTRNLSSATSSPNTNSNIDQYLEDGKNIQYPEMAKENGIQGKVFVQFVVWKDGTIKDVRVVKGVHKTLDSEAQRVVKSMPKWTPGRQRGTAVNARFTLPIKFRIS